MPRQQFGQARDRQIRDPGDDLGEPGLRVDPVQLGGADQGMHEGRALPAALGTGEEPGFSAKRDAAQGAFRRVVGEADPAIVEEPGEAGPVFGRERIIDRLGDFGVLRELRALRPKQRSRDEHSGSGAASDIRESASGAGRRFCGDGCRDQGRHSEMISSHLARRNKSESFAASLHPTGGDHGSTTSTNPSMAWEG